MEINGEQYGFSDKLVIGQYRQLLDVEVGEITTQDGEVDNKKLLNDLISLIPSAKILSILLIPQSMPLWEKDIQTLEKEIEFSLTPQEMDSWVSDFFALCSPQNVIEGMVKLARVNQSLARVT